LSLEKLGQTFFAVMMTKTPQTPLLMGFLVYELNCPPKSDSDGWSSDNRSSTVL
jgi:hypothetical protein